MDKIKEMLELMGYEFHFSQEMTLWTCTSPDYTFLGGNDELIKVIDLAIEHNIIKLKRK